MTTLQPPPKTANKAVDFAPHLAALDKDALLEHAVHCGEDHQAMYALSIGANPDGVPRAAPIDPPLITYVRKRTGWGAVGQAFADHGANLNCRDPHGATPLILAVSRGAIDIVHNLLAHEVDINAKNNRGDTALHCSVGMQSKQITQMLLDADAEVDCTNSHGETPLYTAAKFNAEESALALLNAGADPNHPTNRDPFDTPTTAALGRSTNSLKTKTAALLLRHYGNAHNMTEAALYIASTNKLPEVLTRLHSQGHDIQMSCDLHNNNALTLALGLADYKTAEAALDLGIHTTHKTETANYAIQLAPHNTPIPLFRKLLNDTHPATNHIPSLISYLSNSFPSQHAVIAIWAGTHLAQHLSHVAPTR